MMTNEIAKNYAEALYDAAESSKKAEILLNDLKSVSEIYSTNEEFRDIVNNPALDNLNRKKMLNAIFEKTLDSFSVELMGYLVEKGRFFDIKGIYNEYNKIYNSKNQVEEVVATFAIEPSEEQKMRLSEKLEKMTGKKVKIFIKIDKTILGGGIVKIGDRIIDGSIKRQLEMLKMSL